MFVHIYIGTYVYILCHIFYLFDSSYYGIVIIIIIIPGIYNNKIIASYDCIYICLKFNNSYSIYKIEIYYVLFYVEI